LPLEQVFQREREHGRINGKYGDIPQSAAVRGPIVRIRITNICELRVVEGVKKLRTELEALAFADLN